MMTLRFDMRAPSLGAPIYELYSSAIEMCAWAEDRGALLAVLSEHHRTEDRHLPSPLVLASAIAARTERLPILVAALVLPFYDPVRLAEDISVLDIISSGRVAYVLGVGHRPEEYDNFGLDMRRRGAMADQRLRPCSGSSAAMRSSRATGRSWSPPPRLSRRPIALHRRREHRPGPTSRALRARSLAQSSAPGMEEAYRRRVGAGHAPGSSSSPTPRPHRHVRRRRHRAGVGQLGRHLLHDATTAASYRHGEERVASISTARTVDELRADTAYQIVTVEQAADRVRNRAHPPAAAPLRRAGAAGGVALLERAAEAVGRPHMTPTRGDDRAVRSHESWSGPPAGRRERHPRHRRRPDLELVGVWVHTPEKVGRDAGELAGGEPIGIAATDDVDALLALGPTASSTPRAAPSAARARCRTTCGSSTAGINVVATTSTELVYPPAPTTRCATGLSKAAAGRGASLYASGSSPASRRTSSPLLLATQSGTSARCALIEMLAERPLPGGRRDDGRTRLRPPARLRAVHRASQG